jgi:hypothetical protein
MGGAISRVVGAAGESVGVGVGKAEPKFVFVPGVTGPSSGDYTSAADLPPIPIEWIIAPFNATAAQCPSPAATLRTFGVTNAIVAVLAIVTGCRPIVHKLTRGYLGTRGGKTVRWFWMISLSLQLLANLLVSLLIKNTKGYGHLSILNIFALYSARPRASLVVLMLLRIFVGINLRALRKSEKYRDEIEFVYADSYLTTAIAELFMQLVAAIFIGVTWGRFPNREVKDYMGTMYKFMEALPGITFAGIGGFVPFYRRKDEALPREYRDVHGQLIRSSVNVFCHRIGIACLGCLVIGLGYMFQWFYFDSFLRLPGSLYALTVYPSIIAGSLLMTCADGARQISRLKLLFGLLVLF